MALEVLCAMVEMWISNLRLESIVTPKYLILFFREMGELFIVISVAEYGLVSFGEITNA